MDGKTGAEELITKVLNDPSLLKSLASSAKAAGEEASTEAVGEEK
jgi:type VI secretion system protein ImpB